jgi:tetratricopeptide (TPR) repeat protein
MGYLPADKYNVAWFKLAECIARGEKERALGVYRLLSHSIDNQAFSRQLEGDILLSCNDKIAAYARYASAAKLYQDSGNIREAAAVCEHMVTLEPRDVTCMLMLIELYAALSMKAKVFSCAQRLLHFDLGADDLIKVAQVIGELDAVLDVFQAEQVFQQLIRILARRGWPLHEAASYLNKTVDLLMQSSSAQALQQFIFELQDVDVAWSNYVREYLESAK